MSRVQTGSQRIPLLLVAAAAALAVVAPTLALGGQSDASASGPASPIQAAPADAAEITAAETPGAAPRGAFKWSWGNTVSYGLGSRLSDPDSRLIGIAAGGTAFSVNGDDGNLNYGKGVFTNAVKLTSELQWSYRGIGGFVRAFGFYDYEAETADRVRTELSNAAKRVSAAASSCATHSSTAASSSGGCPASCVPAGR
jgi:hypothetical protein